MMSMAGLIGMDVKKCTDIKGHHALIWLQLYIFDVFQEVLVVHDMVRGSSYQGLDDIA